MVAAWCSPALAQSLETAGNGAFADAQFIPGDVSFYLHLSDGAALRKDLASRPLGAWIEQTHFRQHIRRCLDRACRGVRPQP